MLTSTPAAMSKAAEKPMVEFPYRSRVLKITHRSRIAVPAARKEVVKQFYLGDLITPKFSSPSLGNRGLM